MRELDRIAHQINQYLTELARVRHHHVSGTFDLSLEDSSCLHGFGFEHIDNAGHQFVNIESNGFILETTSLKFRIIQNLVNHSF